MATTAGVSSCRICWRTLGGLYRELSHRGGGKELRIPYLARARSKVLERLLELWAGSEGNGSFRRLF